MLVASLDYMFLYRTKAFLLSYYFDVIIFKNSNVKTDHPKFKTKHVKS